jgi:hypothetical protein
MHLGETGLMIVSTLVILCVSAITLWPITQKEIRQFREMTGLLEEADPAAFEDSFREYVVHRTSVTGYIQDAFPFRTEPFEDTFLLERFEELEVRGSRDPITYFVIGVAMITIGMTYMEYALIYLGAFSKKLPIAVYLTVMAALLFVFMFLEVRFMLRTYRLKLALAEKFAKGSEG